MIFTVTFQHHPDALQHESIANEVYRYRLEASSKDEAAGLALIQFRQAHPKLIPSNFVSTVESVV